MSTINQLEANRRNAQASTGPRTPEGRRASSMNALKSGIHAVSLIIAGEDPDELQALADSLHESCQPADAREQILVDRMIAHEWRRRRLVNAEPIVWEKCFIPLRNSPNFNHETQTGDALHDNQPTFTRIQRLIASVEKSYHQAAADLDRLVRLRTAAQPPADVTPASDSSTSQPEESKPETKEMASIRTQPKSQDKADRVFDELTDFFNRKIQEMGLTDPQADEIENLASEEDPN